MGVLYLVGRSSPLAQEDRRGRRRNVEISVATLEKPPSRGLPRATARQVLVAASAVYCDTNFPCERV
jgi:hypothetical protein